MDRKTVVIPFHQSVSSPMRSGVLSESIGEGIQKRDAAGLDILSEGCRALREMKSLNTFGDPGETAEAAIWSDEDRCTAGSVQMDVRHGRTVHSSQMMGEKHPLQEHNDD